MNNNSIGIFDSGLGGMTVLKKLTAAFPQESFIFFGDTAHVPYGNKSVASIQQFTFSIVKFLKSHSVKLIIVACNTASAVAISKIEKKFNIPIIGVISPLELYLHSHPKYLRVGIIGTQNTINSKAYEKLIFNYNAKIKTFSQACPLFVPLIEEGLENHQIAKIIAKEYLDDIIKSKIELLILGCTHYPIIKSTIKKIIPENIKIIDSAHIVADAVDKYLNKHNLRSNNLDQNLQVFVSDEAHQFEKNASRYLGKNIPNIKTIIL